MTGYLHTTPCFIYVPGHCLSMGAKEYMMSLIVRRRLLSNKVPVVENLRNLDRLHDRRGYFVVLPLLIRDGSASPVRPVVLVDRQID